MANLTGLPSLSLPIGLVEGLPVSLNINGAYGKDKAVLGLAEELEAINITDKEGRQRIEKKFRKRQNEIKKQMDELKEKEAATIK